MWWQRYKKKGEPQRIRLFFLLNGEPNGLTFVFGLYNLLFQSIEPDA